MEIDKSAKEPKMQVRTGGPPGDRTRNPRTKGHSFRCPREYKKAPGLGQLRR
jgi:hypothetical protein